MMKRSVAEVGGGAQMGSERPKCEEVRARAKCEVRNGSECAGMTRK